MRIYPLEKSYGARKVLSLEGLELEPGRIYAVLGPNGSGKSTLARLLAGAVRADGAGPVMDGCHSVGYLPQRPYAFHMSVLSNMRLSGAAPSAAMEQLARYGLEGLARQNAAKLSGGETARMALARLTLRDYQLLILDEPTASMDPEATAAAERQLLAYRDRTGCAVLLVTHSPKQALRLSDELLVFYNGRLAERGPAEQVLRSPRTAETGRFLEYCGS